MIRARQATGWQKNLAGSAKVRYGAVGGQIQVCILLS